MKSGTRPRTRASRVRKRDARRPGLAVLVSNRSGGGRGPALRAPRRVVLRAALEAALTMAAAGNVPAGRRAAIDVVWVSGDEMRALNGRFHGRDGTTDVLAFEGGDIDPETGMTRLGEVICNLELARRAAREHRNSGEAEAVLYATHGFLHLLGETDKAPDGRRRMRKLELAALAAAGLEVRGGEWDERGGEYHS